MQAPSAARHGIEMASSARRAQPSLRPNARVLLNINDNIGS
jgi:hypothetical protein